MAAFAVLTVYNVFFLHNLEVDDNATRFFAITANQQISHFIGATILILLVVELYYAKKNRIGGIPITLGSAVADKEDIQKVHPDIPKDYFEDPTKKSVEDRTNGSLVHDKDSAEKKQE